MNRRHSSKYIVLFIGVESLKGREYNFIIKSVLNIVSLRILFVNKSEQEISLAISKIMVSLQRLETIDQVFIGGLLHF